MWLTFLIKFLIYTAYSVTNKTMVLWLSKDLGFSDQAAGALVGWVWAPAMTIFTLLAGSITDAVGLRRTFFLGVAICTVARSVMVVTTIPSLALACGVLPLAVGEALGTPVLLAATRRYSTVAQRSISFSIIYMIMNVGYIAAGWIFDYIRQFNFHVSFFGLQPSSYQQLFMVSLVFEIVLFSQGNLFADGLRLSKVRNSRTRRERSGRETLRDQRYRDHPPRADRRGDDTKVCGLSNGSDRRSDLRRRSIHHGVANRMVRIGCQRRVRPMAGARLSWIAGKYSPLLRHVRVVSDRVLDRRSFLFTK
ncbi:MAG: hypothetical protein DME58_01815, partial [Verrucomicrobia bacterium]